MVFGCQGTQIIEKEKDKKKSTTAFKNKTNLPWGWWIISMAINKELGPIGFCQCLEKTNGDWFNH